MWVVLGTRVAAELFDVDSFEALSEHSSGGRRFFLVAHADTDIPIWHGHKYTHTHQNPFMYIHIYCIYKSVHSWQLALIPLSRGTFFWVHAEIYTLCNDIGLSCALRGKKQAFYWVIPPL